MSRPPPPWRSLGEIVAEIVAALAHQTRKPQPQQETTT
jgi:hypothetical protein